MFQNLYKKNRKKLQKRLEKESVAVFFSNYKMPRNGDQYFPFRQQSDLFYLSGIKQPKTILLLSDEEEMLLIEKPNTQDSLWEGNLLSEEEASDISGIENIKYSANFHQIFQKIISSKKTVYFNTTVKIPQEEIKTKDEYFLDWFRETYPYHQYKNIKPELVKLRMVKEPEEIQSIQEAIRITEQSFSQLVRVIRPGKNEKEIEARLRYEFMLRGCNYPSFDPVIATGKNACTLHYTNNNTKMQNGDLLLMDIGAESNYYAADISRTVPVNGKFTEKQKKYYNAVLDVLHETIRQIVPGMTLKQLNNFSKERLTEKHLSLGLYSQKENKEKGLVNKYFPHSVSHFMGIDVHDYGNKEIPLEKGMVITCEPGLYIPEENTGIRIEDDILVDDKPVNLAENIPKTAEEIEEIMHAS
ncbi:MAG: aminopeptidase P family protein [Bacteroidales bacterium]